jgi:hypothetical protein
MTESIRTQLPSLIREFGVDSILDVPCGDFSWMSQVDLQGITYIGVDIVRPLIEELKIRHSSKNFSFLCLDATKDMLPNQDLILTRDLLFHLSYKDILHFLQNILKTDFKYFLSTSYENEHEFRNSDIFSGGFRLIDLFSRPFNFPTDYKYCIEEPSERRLPERKLFLWNKAQVESACLNLQEYLKNS